MIYFFLLGCSCIVEKSEAAFLYSFTELKAPVYGSIGTPRGPLPVTWEQGRWLVSIRGEKTGELHTIETREPIYLDERNRYEITDYKNCNRNIRRRLDGQGPEVP